MEKGLSSNLAFCLEQDSKGFMWIGTLSGLNKYDGNEVTAYRPELNPGSITSSVIFTVYEDSKERLWIGTDGGGLNRYIRDREEFISYKHDPYEPLSISSDQVYAILEDREGLLWVGTDGGGLNRMLKEGEFVSYRKNPEERDSLKSDIIRVLFQDSKGNIYAGTEGGGLSIIKNRGKTIKSYITGRKPGSIPADTVRSILEDSMGNIWIGLQNGGISRFDPDTGIFHPLLIPGFEKQGDISVRAIYEDTDRKLWIGTEKEGIYLYSLTDHTWEEIKTNGYDNSALSSNTIRSIYADKNGLIWIGTRDGGVNLFNPLSAKFSSIQENRENSFFTKKKQSRAIIQTRDKKIWYATDGGGLYSFDRGTGEIKNFSRENSGDRLTSNQCYSLAEDPNGLLWVGTDGGGLNLFDPVSGKWIKHYMTGDKSSLSSNTIWDLFIDRENNLWVGTEGGGLNLFDRKSETFTSYKYDPKNIYSLNGNSVRDILEDSKGRLWVGTWDGGLNLYQRDRKQFVRFRFDPDSDLSIGDNSVNVIFEDLEERIWIGTSGGGLSLYNSRDQTFRTYSEKEGLAGTNVLGIIEDFNSNLWITTENGLNLYLDKSGKFYTFGKEDGLLGNDFTHKSYCITDSGEIFIGGTQGINYFYPDNIINENNSTEIVMTDFHILNRQVPIGVNFGGREILKKSITETEKITLTQDEKLFSFYFSILDYTAPERNRYYTYLEGYDRGWNYRGNRNFITFDSLPHGTYHLKVKGTDHTGIEIPGNLELEIRILPYFWQTLYFRVFIAAAGVLTVFLIVRQRTRSLEKHNRELRMFSSHILEIREEERKKVAREVHDELGQILTALKIDLFQFKDKDKSGKMLSLVNMALDSVKNLSTRLRPKALDTLSLSEALQWQTVEFQQRTKIKCTVNLQDIEEEFDKETSTAIFRIYQEILTNIIRHSEADHVHIDFYLTDNRVFLKVSDNGKGIPPGKISSSASFGIIGMKERCNMIGGKLKISSSPRGSVIELTVPLKSRSSIEKASVNKTLYDTLDSR